MASCERATSLEQLIDALRIRTAVFTIEQGLPVGWDPEEADKAAAHYLARVDDVAVATARLREVSEKSLKIERMAVLSEYRGRQIGTALTLHLVEESRQRRASRIWLDAQSAAAAFYARLGFKPVSEPHRPWGLAVPHITMEYAE